MSSKAAPVTPQPLSRVERLVLALERALDKWLSPIGVWVYRRTNGQITRAWKVEALVLTTRGRRTGRPRTVVLRFFPDRGEMIVAAANDGAERLPGWYFKLAANPDATVDVMGRTISVRAWELPSDEAADWWQRIVVAEPSYERFARATDRRMPILRLTPVAQL